MSSTDGTLAKAEEKDNLPDTNEEEDDDDDASSTGECIDSPEAFPSNEGEENVDATAADNEGKPFISTMEGELDFEDEDRENKVEVPKSKSKKRANNNKEEKLSDGEEGQVLSESDTKPKGEADDEDDDDGEISDEDDLDEGEVIDNSPSSKQPTRQVCRFFNRGQCTWGTLCRFLHLSVNERGHYNMFAPSPRPDYVPPGNGYGMGPASNILNSGMMNQRSGFRGGPDFMPAAHFPPPPPPEIPPAESAWERGLRHAKELMKKAIKRKEQEPDFEEKRLNLGIDDSVRAPPEYEKENRAHEKLSYRRQNDIQAYKYEEDDVYDNGEREAREHWRGGRYDNFEIRWTRQQMYDKERREKDRSRSNRVSSEREKVPNRGKNKERWRDDRLVEVQSSTKPRADEWRDPWRRSKSPRGKRSTSRGRSRGSYSSVSSRSYSDRSGSYSRSSSRSSFYSSRSPSLTRDSQPKPPSRTGGIKRKARSSSSRSRSGTRTPSVSRSRTYSRSLSMDSVSSASSSSSHSSSGSVSKRKHNQHRSILRNDESPPPVKTDSKPVTSSLFEEMQRLIPDAKDETPIEVSAREHNLSDVPLPDKAIDDEMPYPSLRNLLPASEKVLKDPVKYSMHKQRIKMTLLNRAITTKSAFLPKKELEGSKPTTTTKDEPSKLPANPTGIKRPASPPTIGVKPVLAPLKKSTSSRRDELMKQLKAVEDAIARKRAKFN